MPSYLLPHTQIVKKKAICLYKKLLFLLFNPHPHLERIWINLYMNEKKFFRSEKRGIPLSIEETNRTSQLGFDLYNFCRAFHNGSSEKKSKFYHLSVQRFLQNKLYFFENLIFQKSCLAFLSEDGFDDASPAAFDQSSS